LEDAVLIPAAGAVVEKLWIPPLTVAMSASTSEQRNVPVPWRASAEESKSMAAADHRVQVAAARLRVTLHQRLGPETPAKTKALAKEQL
jgi:purine-nucleoside phosphorylase